MKNFKLISIAVLVIAGIVALKFGNCLQGSFSLVHGFLVVLFALCLPAYGVFAFFMQSCRLDLLEKMALSFALGVGFLQWMCILVSKCGLAYIDAQLGLYALFGIIAISLLWIERGKMSPVDWKCRSWLAVLGVFLLALPFFILEWASPSARLGAHGAFHLGNGKMLIENTLNPELSTIAGIPLNYPAFYDAQLAGLAYWTGAHHVVLSYWVDLFALASLVILFRWVWKYYCDRKHPIVLFLTLLIVLTGTVPWMGWIWLWDGVWNGQWGELMGWNTLREWIGETPDDMGMPNRASGLMMLRHYSSFSNSPLAYAAISALAVAVLGTQQQRSERKQWSYAAWVIGPSALLSIHGVFAVFALPAMGLGAGVGYLLSYFKPRFHFQKNIVWYIASGAIVALVPYLLMKPMVDAFSRPPMLVSPAHPMWPFFVLRMLESIGPYLLLTCVLILKCWVEKKTWYIAIGVAALLTGVLTSFVWVADHNEYKGYYVHVILCGILWLPFLSGFCSRMSRKGQMIFSTGIILLLCPIVLSAFYRNIARKGVQHPGDIFFEDNRVQHVGRPQLNEAYLWLQGFLEGKEWNDCVLLDPVQGYAAYSRVASTANTGFPNYYAYSPYFESSHMKLVNKRKRFWKEYLSGDGFRSDLLIPGRRHILIYDKMQFANEVLAEKALALIRSKKDDLELIYEQGDVSIYLINLYRM